MLELRKIQKYYHMGTINEMCLFKDLNLKIKKGEFLSIIGSNGSGKTSMLNILCGNILADSGEILLHEKNISKLKDYKRNRTIGRVYQDLDKGTCPRMTIYENMSLAENKGKMYGLGRALDKRKKQYFQENLSKLKLGLENKMDVKVGNLSGGQRQGLALLMATLTPIEILILDEHTAALDPKVAENIMELTNRIVKEKELTTIMVTHNLKHAVDYGNRLLMMHKGEIIMDLSGEEKAKVEAKELFEKFTEVSIE
ncbi:ABC transporter ATP-binding protein [Faecalimonas sp.]